MKKAKNYFLALGILLLVGPVAFGQVPTISNLSLAASSPDNLTIDQLICTYTTGTGVTETVSAWYKDGVPVNTLYLPFEAWEDPNALMDFSGSNHNAVYPTDVFAEPEWQTNYGIDGTGGFIFDGDAYLIVEEALPLGASYSKTVWVRKATGSSGFRNIMSSAVFEPNNHSFKIDNTGRLNAGHSEGSSIVVDTDTLNSDQWYFLAVTFDYTSGEMALFRDGNEVDRQVVPLALRSVVDDTILIGSMNYNWFWYGNIDEPRVFNTALTPEQVSSLYNNGNDLIVPEETIGGEDWFVDITPFSSSNFGSTTRSNTLTIRTLVVSDIPDQSISEGSPFTVIDLDAYMVDYGFADNEITWAATGNSELSVSISAANFATVTIPDADWYGSENITFTATNPNGDSDGAVVSFTVQNVNDAPVIVAASDQSTPEDTNLTGLTVEFSDLDPTDSHTITVVSGNSNVSIDNLSGHTDGSTYDLLLAADWNGNTTITVTVTDNGTGNLSDQDVFTLVVTPVNDSPELTGIGDQTVSEDNSLIGLPVNFSDPDLGDAHTITVVSDEPNVVVDNLSGHTDGSTYNLVPAAGWSGSAQITVTVTDDGVGNLSDMEIYTLTVNAVNDAPVLTDIGDQAIDEDDTITGLIVAFTDAESSDLHTITVVSDEPNVVVENLSGHIDGSTYDLVPAADWNGTAQITVTVTDDGIGTLEDSETYTLTVNPINDTPVLTEIGNQSTDEDIDLLGLSVVFADPDDIDTHTISVVASDPSVINVNLSGQVSGSTYDLSPAANWFGTVQITVSVTDDGTGALSDFEIYTLTVNPVNDAPIISELGDQNVNEDGALHRIPVTFTDEVMDSHIVAVVSGNPNVVVANFGGHTSGSTYSLVPRVNWNGTAQITVTVTEAGSTGLSDMETYMLTVNPINDAPDTVRLSSTVVDEKVSLETVVGLFSSYDVDMTDTHTYTFVLDGGVNDVDNGAFIIVGDTLKTNVNLDYESKSSYSILVQSDDGQGGTASQNFTIEINDLDETGVEDIYNNPSFNVYPVPAIDNITVEVDNPDNKELLLEIYSNTGRLLFAEPIYTKSIVDLTGFTNGMYILKIKGDQINGTRKIIVKDR